MRISFPKQVISSTVLALGLLIPLAPAQAGPFTIGNATPAAAFLVQGESFTPAVPGNIGSGSAPASGNVFLETFKIDYFDLASAFANLYIYGTLPTTADASTGAGSLAVGTHLGGGVYQFSGVALDVNTKYFAVLPGSTGIFDNSGDLYSGGIDIFDRPPPDGQLDEGFGDFDIGFQATFDTPVPPTAALLLLGLAGLRFSRRKQG